MQELSVAERRTRHGPDAANHFEEILDKENRTKERYKAIEDLKDKVKNVEYNDYGDMVVPEDWTETEIKYTKEIANETEQKMVSASHTFVNSFLN